jgi:hypothetical protein
VRTNGAAVAVHYVAIYRSGATDTDQ